MVPDFKFVQTALTSMSFDYLAGFDGNVTFSSQLLTTVRLPALRSIGGSLVIQGNSVLNAVVLPSLRTVGGDVLISNNVALGAFLTNADVLGSVTLAQPGGASFKMSFASVVGSVAISNAPATFSTSINRVGLNVVLANNPLLTTVGEHSSSSSSHGF